MNWVELYAFGITGLRLSPPQVKVLNALFVLTSYPDPRLWNNRVAALAGSARSTGALGVAAVYTPKDFELNRIMMDIVGLVDQTKAAAE